MGLTHLSLTNIRCFGSLEVSFDSDCVVIEGPNGSGKSSLVEALYYACYLKSFRTHRAGDVPRHGDDHFFIKVQGILSDGDCFSIQVGYEEGAKRVKVNDAAVESYRELMDYYKVVAVSEHDLGIIQEGPEERRFFINQLCLLQDPTMADLLRLNKHLVEQRGGLLAQGLIGTDQGKIWSEQLWINSQEIRHRRLAALALLETELTVLAADLSLSFGTIRLVYKPKGGAHETFAQFWSMHESQGLQQEAHQRRTLFGAHLDDVIVTVNDKNARIYASRGQQKLIVLLLKCAMIRILSREQYARRALVFILDDFITDLDQAVITAVLALICNLDCGIVITSPLTGFIKPPKPFQVLSLGQN